MLNRFFRGNEEGRNVKKIKTVDHDADTSRKSSQTRTSTNRKVSYNPYE